MRFGKPILPNLLRRFQGDLLLGWVVLVEVLDQAKQPIPPIVVDKIDVFLFGGVRHRSIVDQFPQSNPKSIASKCIKFSVKQFFVVLNARFRSRQSCLNSGPSHGQFWVWVVPIGTRRRSKDWQSPEQQKKTNKEQRA
jgi:hypothetical protein